MDIIKSFKWRYATKQFDPNKKITTKELETVLNAINLAPSSYGLQPYSVVVVENNELRKKLNLAAYNQPQIENASQVIIFAANKKLSENHIDNFIERISIVTGVPTESLIDYAGMMKNKISSMNPDQLFVWASKQCYIGLGFLLTTCAHMGIDACPMEGFEPSKFDEILNLKEKNLGSVVMATIGKRSSKDKHQYNPKVRKSLENFVLKYE